MCLPRSRCQTQHVTQKLTRTCFLGLGQHWCELVRDTAKQDPRALLSPLIVQLSDQSDMIYSVLCTHAASWLTRKWLGHTLHDHRPSGTISERTHMHA